MRHECSLFNPNSLTFSEQYFKLSSVKSSVRSDSALLRHSILCSSQLLNCKLQPSARNCISKMCNGNLTALDKQVKKVNKLPKIKIPPNSADVKRDALASVTYYTKVGLIHLNHICGKIQGSQYYQLLQKTTQPAHLITLISGFLLTHILMPSNHEISEITTPSPFLKLIYLGSFATHFGFQIWMTFISGLSLYLALPRHAFGEVQKILFPKYFTLNGILSLITLFTFVKYQKEAVENSVLLQITALVLCFCVELTIRLYMTPSLLYLINERNQMELAANVGMEIGDYNPGSLVNCSEYMGIHIAFRKVHITIAIGNMITIGCSAIHLFYLSSRLCI